MAPSKSSFITGGLLSLLSLGANAIPNPITGYRHHDSTSSLDDCYDYVIVGGGTSALTVANRLTEDPDVSVLVVEYGYLDNNETVLIPYYANFNRMSDLWNITSTPLEHMNGLPSPVLTAAVVGGGSVVNGMFFDRAAASDYDAWEELGNPGWDFEGLFPYFRKSTNFSEPSDYNIEQFNYTYNVEAWGTEGPVHATLAPFQYEPYQSLMWEAFREVNPGIPYPREGADGSAIGVFWVPASEDPSDMTRSSARTAYYDPIAYRPNLHLITGTKVDKITFDGKTAEGIVMTNRETNETTSAKASLEVILAAGPIFSPNVLQVSGVGPAAMLEEAGIEVVHDLPGVGSNFQDHPTAYLAWNYTTEPYFPQPDSLFTNATYNAEQEALYYANASGAWIQARGNSAAFLTLRDIDPDHTDAILSSLAAQNTTANLPPLYTTSPTLLSGYAKQHAILSRNLGQTDSAMYELPFNGGSTPANAMERPFSRGSISLDPSNPHGLPIVDFNAFANPIDPELAVSMLQFTQRYFASPVLAPLSPSPLSPPGNITSRPDLELWARQNMGPSFAHPSCACPMMPLALGGVVDPSLKVYGLEKLSIVDASVMPLIPATHLQATVYAVAEKAADLIKERNEGCVKSGRDGEKREGRY
ncbi:hypothetical protein MBLNU230_g8482t1 [Neophaeotheca triangularis]